MAFFLVSLAILSGIGVAIALVIPGWVDLLLLAGPVALASFGLLLKNLWGLRSKGPKNWAIVDGSNVMYWHKGSPSPDPLAEVRKHLVAQGYTPRFFFDANAGYRLVDRYLTDRDFEEALQLPRGAVTVVPKGTIADEAILHAARKLGAIVITNDRYRDWANRFPEVSEKGFLVRGGHSSKGLTLELGEWPENQPMPA